MSILPDRIHGLARDPASPGDVLVTTERALLLKLVSRALGDIEAELTLFPTPHPMAVMDDERRRYARDLLTEQRDYTAIRTFLKDLEQ